MEIFGLNDFTFYLLWRDVSGWLGQNVFTWNMLLQLLLVGAALFIAWRYGKPIDREDRLEKWLINKVRKEDPWFRRLGTTLDNLLVPIFWLALQWLLNLLMYGIGQPHDLMRITASLLNAWVLINLMSVMVSSPFWQRVFAIIAWSVAALYVTRLLGPMQTLLDSFAFTLGDARLSPYIFLKAILIGALMLWLAGAAYKLLQLQLSKVPDLTPSVEVLILKLVRFALILVAVLIALSAVGIKLTTLAVFSGAIGIGIGFGLQKVISNFISGVILLLDRSIRPGDVIEIEGTYGQVKNLGARHTSVITRDGTEYLIPNENMITEQVINWSYSNTNVRRKVPIGVAYHSDVNLARRLVLEAAAETPRVLEDPTPKCHLMGFGENSVDLEARFWIRDPHNGVHNVKSDFLLLVWEKFREHRIDIPFPQRDLYIKGDAPIRVEVSQPPKPPARKPRAKKTAAKPVAKAENSAAASKSEPAATKKPPAPKTASRKKTPARRRTPAKKSGPDGDDA